MIDERFKEVEERLREWTCYQKNKGIARENFVEAAVRFMIEEIGLTENEVQDFFARTRAKILVAQFRLIMEDPKKL